MHIFINGSKTISKKQNWNVIVSIFVSRRNEVLVVGREAIGRRVAQNDFTLFRNGKCVTDQAREKRITTSCFDQEKKGVLAFVLELRRVTWSRIRVKCKYLLD